MKQWYEALYENYAHKYDKECFVHGTAGECDFVEAEINHDKSLKIIDIGCGTGGHAIELTKRGYKVIGIDLSDSQLKRAREKAKEYVKKGTVLFLIKAGQKKIEPSPFSAVPFFHVRLPDGQIVIPRLRSPRFGSGLCGTGTRILHSLKQRYGRD